MYGTQISANMKKEEAVTPFASYSSNMKKVPHLYIAGHAPSDPIGKSTIQLIYGLDQVKNYQTDAKFGSGTDQIFIQNLIQNS